MNDDFKIKKMSNNDIYLLYDYLSAEPEYNLFIYGDLETYGLDGEHLNIWCVEKDGKIDSILMRFKEYYIPYSKINNFICSPIVEKLRELKAVNISGKKQVIERISLEIPQLVLTETHLAKLDKLLINDDYTTEVKTAKLKDLEEITQFYCEIGEFDTRNRYQRSLERSREYINTGTGRFFYMRTDGVISAVAATTAENSKSAMVVGVATAFKYRNKGYATMVVTALCNKILGEGKEFLCLFYYNPSAGRIYERIGFRKTGTWIMGKM